jgi:transcriptional regulator GlxA family with amidase domain
MMRHCKRAMEYMDAHLADPVSLADLADATGVSARALEECFHQRLNKPPMTVLREKRLEAIHNELLHPSQETTVKSLMWKYGFVNASDLVRYYQAMFRETPCATLLTGLKHLLY